jgi:ABC-type Fe3+ transport system permease subunit
VQACPPTSALEIGLRPEHVQVSDSGSAAIEAEVMLVERLGERSLVYARLSTGARSPPRTRAPAASRPATASLVAVDGARRTCSDRTAPASTAARSMSGATTRRDPGLAFVAPFLLVYVLVLILPMLHGIWLSLHVIDIWGDGRFAGSGQLRPAGGRPDFGQSLGNTFLVTLMVVPILTIIALALAPGAQPRDQGAAVLRGIFFSSAVCRSRS